MYMSHITQFFLGRAGMPPHVHPYKLKWTLPATSSHPCHYKTSYDLCYIYVKLAIKKKVTIFSDNSGKIHMHINFKLREPPNIVLKIN